MPPKKSGPRNHMEARSCICGICFTKGIELKNITPELESLIQKFVNSSFTLCNSGLPSVICGKCRLKLSRLKNNPNGANNLPVANLKNFGPPPPCTRSHENQSCQCALCQLTRGCLKQDTKALLTRFAFTPSSIPESKPDPSVKKQCLKCFSYLGPGLSHKCNKKTKIVNQQNMVVRSNSSRSKAKVVSNVVKNIFKERGVDRRGGTAQLETGAKPLRVTLGENPKDLVKSRRFSLENMMKLQTSCNLSDKTLLKIAAAQRTVFGRKSVQPNLKSSLYDRNHRLDPYFSVKSQLMGLKKNKDTGERIFENRTGVYCNNLDELVSLTLLERGLTPSTTTGLIGLDQGQGSLKVALTLVSNQCEESESDHEKENSRRSTYSEGVASKDFKLSSVKRLLILSIYPEVPEVHSNLKNILSELNIDAIDSLVSADIKMLNLLCGKPEGKPHHACPFCNIGSPYTSTEYQLYIIEDLYSWHMKYLEDGSKYKKQKEYQNIVNCPLITGPPDKKVLDLLNLPSLHILIGVPDKLIKELENGLFETPEEGVEIIDTFLKENSIVRKKKQGKSSLEGNQTRQFLNRLDKLEQAFLQAGGLASINGLPFISVLRAFNRVVEDCFSKELKESYRSSIREFEKQYRDLQISITPKVFSCLFGWLVGGIIKTGGCLLYILFVSENV